MSTNYSTTNQSYKHLSEAERGEIEAYLSVKPAEIASGEKSHYYS